MNLAKNKFYTKPSSGFTVPELLVITVIIVVLLTVLALTYGGVQIRQRNNTRITDIKLIQSSLETYYSQSGFYPTIGEMNSTTWTSAHLKNLNPTTLVDPSAKAGTSRFSSSPKLDYYAYQPTTSTGSSCDDKTVPCGEYTLTATLEGNSGTFVEKSLN